MPIRKRKKHVNRIDQAEHLRSSPQLSKNEPISPAQTDLGFRRLARAMASPKPTVLSHADCEAVLEFYVDDEQKGEPVHEFYPTVWQHLKSCEHCRRSYTLLKESLQETLSQPVVASVRAAQPQRAAAALLDQNWIKYSNPRSESVPFSFGVMIPAAYSRKHLTVSLSGAAMREKPSAPERSLLLFDTFALEHRDIDMEIWTQRTGEADQVQLQIALVSADPLPAPLYVTLKWEDHRASRLVQNGQAAFTKMAASDLETHDLQVEFSDQAPSDSIEG